MSFAEEPYGALIDTTMRVMTWNVWGRFGPWEQRAAGIERVILETTPDVVLLQECWLDREGADQASALGRELGLHHAFGGGELLFDTWGLGNGMLSRWPIVDHRVEPLPALDDTGWGGLATRAVIDGPRGGVLVWCVALDWPPHASAARQHALRHLAAVIDADVRATKVPLVVGGDFNASPDSDEVRMLVGMREVAHPGFVLFDAWAVAPGGLDAGATWSRSNPWAAPNLLPDRRIDYLFTGWPRRGGAGSAVAAGLAGVDPVDGLVPSDHYAVVADLRY